MKQLCIQIWFLVSSKKLQNRKKITGATSQHIFKTGTRIFQGWRSVFIFLLRWNRWSAFTIARRKRAMEETILEMWMYWTRLRHQLNHCSQIIQNKVERSKNYEVLSKWMAAAKQRRLHRRNINKCFLRSRLKRETAVVQRWSIAKVSKKTLTRLGKLVGGHLHRSTSSRCFKLWRVFAGQKHTLQKGSSKLGERIQLLRLEFTFQTWLQAFKNVLRLRQILGRSSQQCSIRLIRRGWNCFELNSKLRRQSQTKAASAKRHRSQVLITESFKILRERFRYSKRERNKVQKICGFTSHHSIHNALLAWRERVTKRKFKRSRQAKVCIQANKRILTQSCVDWYECARILGRARLVLGKSRTRLGNHVLRSAFSEWSENKNMLKRQSAIINTLQRNQGNRLCISFIDIWHQLALRSKKIKRAVSNLKGRCDHLNLAHDFGHWQKEVKSKKKRGHVFQKVLQRTERGGLDRVWKTWKESSVLNHKANKLRSNILAHLVSESVTSAFDTWKSSVQYIKRLSSKSSQVLQHCKFHSITYTFRAWSSKALSKRRQTTSLMRHLPRTNRRRRHLVLDAWRQYFSNKRRLLKAGKDTTSLYHKAQRRDAWESWRETVLLVRTLLLLSGRSSTRTAGQLSSWAFERWKSRSEELLHQRQWMAKLAKKMRHLVEAAAFLVRIDDSNSGENSMLVNSKLLRYCVMSVAFAHFCYPHYCHP